jgi:hypothetical protein
MLTVFYSFFVKVSLKHLHLLALLVPCNLFLSSRRCAQSNKDVNSTGVSRVSGDLLTETREINMARYYVAGVSKIIAGITKKSAFKFSIEWKAHLNVQKSGAALQVKSQKDSAKY